MAVAGVKGSSATDRPPRSSETGGLFWKAIITWNSGWRAIERAGLTSSTSRSNGRSWCAYAARSVSRTRPTSSRKLGSPPVSVRSTSVLTNIPTRSSSASSVRPAITDPMGMSVPAPSRVSSAASAACTTMNRLAFASRASFTNAACSSGSISRWTVSPRWVAVAGRGRSAGSSSWSGSPSSADRQNAICRETRLSGSVSSPSSSRCHSA